MKIIVALVTSFLFINKASAQEVMVNMDAIDYVDETPMSQPIILRPPSSSNDIIKLRPPTVKKLSTKPKKITHQKDVVAKPAPVVKVEQTEMPPATKPEQVKLETKPKEIKKITEIKDVKTKKETVATAPKPSPSPAPIAPAKKEVIATKSTVVTEKSDEIKAVKEDATTLDSATTEIKTSETIKSKPFGLLVDENIDITTDSKSPISMAIMNKSGESGVLFDALTKKETSSTQFSRSSDVIDIKKEPVKIEKETSKTKEKKEVEETKPDAIKEKIEPTPEIKPEETKLDKTQKTADENSDIELLKQQAADKEAELKAKQEKQLLINQLPSGTVVATLKFARNVTTMDNVMLNNISSAIEPYKDDATKSFRIVGYASSQGEDFRARRFSLTRAVNARLTLLDMDIHSSRIEIQALGDKSQDDIRDKVEIIIIDKK